MLRISLNSYDLDLPDNISIEMTAINPIFSQTCFDEAYSYSFQIPKTSKNKSIANKLGSKYAPIKILFSNALIDEGVARVKTNFDSFSIEFRNESIDVRKKLEDTDFSSIDYGTVTICDQSDSPTLKISKWYDHMMQTTVTDPHNSGSHKFPWIQANYQLNQDDELWTRNVTHGNNSFFINGYISGVFQQNSGLDTALYGTKGEWNVTVSPCLRIEYMLNCILSHFGISIDTNELNEVPEFLEMIHFSTKTMDKKEVDTILDLQYNVHGTEINLTDFVPVSKTIELINMLNSLFGIMVSIKRSKISIRLKNRLLKKPYVDISKYLNPNFEQENIEGSNLKYIYPIDYNERNTFGDSKWSYLIDSTLGFADFVTFDKHKTRTIGNGDSTDEIELPYIPLISIFDYNYITNIRRSRFAYPYNFVSSFYDFENFVGSEKFIVGLIRGIYQLKEGSTYQDRLVFENSSTFDDIDARTGHEYQFGSCSIFANDKNSHLDVYQKDYISLLYRSRTITKMLYLPLHVIQEIKEWKNPNHIVKQRNLSFRGTVREINFTLYKNSISPAKIKYAVLDPERQGDYNDDYNEDFLI